MDLNRRQFVLGAAGAALPVFGAKKATPPPNVVLVLADDLASWMLGCYGNKEIKTPNIDTLARSGMRFINSFVNSPICSASRATLFTGRTPRQTGIHDFLTDSPIEKPPQGQKDVPASFANEVMVSDVLSKAGYNCGYVGKWHLGHDEQPQHGFNYTYTMKGGSRSYSDPTMYLNGKAVEEKGYLTELMTRRSLEFLDQQSTSKPFFLTVGYLNPHTPYDGHPKKYYDMYADTKFDTIGYDTPAANALREKDMLKDVVGNLRKCAAATTALDDQIPLLLRRLQDRGFRDNTLVIFTGDNGYLLGRHGLWSKGLASDPINMYEEVMQVPMLWHWPGRIPAESATSELISFYDFMPTMCDLVDAEVPNRKLCGRSYLPLALRQKLPKKEPWTTSVFGEFRNTFMSRDRRYKIVIRNDAQGPNELFDVIADPRERVNQYNNPQFITVRDRLLADLQRWKARSA